MGRGLEGGVFVGREKKEESGIPLSIGDDAPRINRGSKTLRKAASLGERNVYLAREKNSSINAKRRPSRIHGRASFNGKKALSPAPEKRKTLTNVTKKRGIVDRRVSPAMT